MTSSMIPYRGSCNPQNNDCDTRPAYWLNPDSTMSMSLVSAAPIWPSHDISLKCVCAILNKGGVPHPLLPSMACNEFEARVVLISVDDESPRIICRARGQPMPCNPESSEWGACMKGMLQHRIEVRDGEDGVWSNAVGMRTC